MPPLGRRIDGLCRQLGLICAFTRTARDRELNPEIWKLYKSLDAISNAYRNDDAETIRLEYAAIGRIPDLFLAPYGGQIWCGDVTERAGVLKAGDERSNGLYPKDLYWEAPEDQALCVTPRLRKVAFPASMLTCVVLRGHSETSPLRRPHVTVCYSPARVTKTTTQNLCTATTRLTSLAAMCPDLLLRPARPGTHRSVSATTPGLVSPPPMAIIKTLPSCRSLGSGSDRRRIQMR